MHEMENGYLDKPVSLESKNETTLNIK